MINLCKFDDVVIDKYGRWASICKTCAEKHRFNPAALSPVAGEEICDVSGCNNEADYYVQL